MRAKKVKLLDGLFPSEDFTFVDVETKTIFLYTEIDDDLALEVSKAIPYLDKINGDLTVKINSYGGYADSAYTIITELKSQSSNLITDIVGPAYSAAALIALAGDERLISNYGTIMFHNANWEQEGKLEDFEDFLGHMKEQEKRILKLLLEPLEIDYKKFVEKYYKKDWYLSPQEALKMGLVHEIY